MDIETEDSPPISQKPYNLSFKHPTWVQKELETLEKAGNIVQSVSPWASPISFSKMNSTWRTPKGKVVHRLLCIE